MANRIETSLLNKYGKHKFENLMGNIPLDGIHT
jgi:hypothetical protein